MEGFCGLEVGTDVQGVGLALVTQALFAFFQSGTEKGIAVGGEDQFPGLEVEGDDGDVLTGNGKSVDDGISDVLLAHGFYHVWENDGPCSVVVQQFVLCGALGHLAAGFVGTHGSQLGLVGLGVLIVLGGGLLVMGVANGRGQRGHQTVAVADKPQLARHPAVDDGRGCHAVFGMLGQPGQERPLVVLADVGRHTLQEGIARRGLGHALYVAADELHGIAAVGPEKAVAERGLRGTAVNDGNEVRGDDDSVLAFLFWVLGDEVLFDDLHRVYDWRVVAADRQRVRG